MSHARSRTFASIALLVVSAAARGAPLERDVWYAFVDGAQRYGYEHVRVLELPDGNFSYLSESRILIDLFGVQRQEITGRGEYVVSPSLRPISLEFVSTRMSGTMRATGRMQGDELTVTVTRAGIETTNTFRVRSSKPLIPFVCLDDWLASLPAETERATVRLLGEENWQIQTAVVTRERRNATGTAWQVDIDDGQMQGTIVSDVDGIVRERVFEIPKLHVTRCTAEEAQDIDYRTLDGRYLLTFPLDKFISAPHRLTSLTVRLNWGDIPLDEFELQDDRQKLLEQSEKDGRFTAVVKITPATAITQPARYPITGDEHRPFLAETQYIKPHDEDIIAAARQAVKGTENALEAVRALSAWVQGYIEAGMIAETLSGPEVLACKKGKCSEFSTLFASLSRSIGIPTRIVLGERMVAGQWVGHMWNEAYVGRWITVDAGANEVGESFSLLKFIHSDTVNGTQPLRWKLTTTLNISITEFELSPSGLAGQYETGIDGNVYTNADYACRLPSPVATWEIEDKSKPGVVTVRFRIPGADDVLIHFVAFAVPPDTPPKSTIDARLSFFRSRYKQFKVIKNEPCIVQGAAGHTLRFARVSADDPANKYLTTEVVWVRGSFGYLLNLIAPESGHAKYLPEFEKLLAAVEHLGD